MKKRSLFLLGRQILQREAVDTSLDCFILIYKGAYDHLFTLFQLVIYIENNCHEFSGWNVPVDSLSLLWLKKVWVTKKSVSASFRVKICLSNTWLAQCYSFKRNTHVFLSSNLGSSYLTFCWNMIIVQFIKKQKLLIPILFEIETIEF